MNTTTNTQELNVNKVITLFMVAVTIVATIVCLITEKTA